MVRKDVEAKKSIIDLFLTKFTLTEEEAGIIKSGDAPIGTRFFQVMDKIDKIRDDCRVLMVGEEGPTQSGCASFYLFPRPYRYLSRYSYGLQDRYHVHNFILPRTQLWEAFPLDLP